MRRVALTLTLALIVSGCGPEADDTVATTTTTSSTGLTVHAELDQATYPTGVKIPDTQMKALETEHILTRHDFHGEWNYTLSPKPQHADSGLD